jgi:hypothetical protein
MAGPNTAATDHTQVGIREFDHPGGVCRQGCALCLAQVLTEACVLPGSNNVLVFHDTSPFRFGLGSREVAFLLTPVVTISRKTLQG